MFMTIINVLKHFVPSWVKYTRVLVPDKLLYLSLMFVDKACSLEDKSISMF
jgi:hypothetical protein